MRSSAEGGDACMGKTEPDRRAVAAGLFCAGCGIFGPSALAQTMVPIPQQSPTDEEARLLANLFTRMAVEAKVDGRSGLIFVMDTGAGRTAIARDVAEDLALPPGPPIMVHGLTSAELTPTVKITRLSFGGRRFSDIYAGVYPRTLLGADGLMGLDVLSQFQLDFDLVRRTLVLTPTGPELTEFGVAFDSATRLHRRAWDRTRRDGFGQLLLVSARVSGVQADCFVDSGAQYSIGNLALLRAVAGGRDSPTQRRLVTVYGVTGQSIQAEREEVSQLVVGSRRLGPTSLLFADLHAFETLDLIQRPALLLGADVLYRFRRVSLDFGRSRMEFGPLRRAGEGMARR